MYNRRKRLQSSEHHLLPSLGSLAGSRQQCKPLSTCSCLGFTWDRSHLPHVLVEGKAKSLCKSAQPIVFPGWINSSWWANPACSNYFQTLINAEVQAFCLVSACLSLPQLSALDCNSLRAMLREQESSISTWPALVFEGPLSPHHRDKLWECLELT